MSVRPEMEGAVSPCGGSGLLVVAWEFCLVSRSLSVMSSACGVENGTNGSCLRPAGVCPGICAEVTGEESLPCAPS